MDERIIHGDACVAEGAAYLAKQEPRFKQALTQTGPLPLRLKSDGFPALLDAIVGQQISVASANSIWKRLEQAKLTQHSRVLAATEQDLKECGLSRPKVRYAKALAEANLDYAAFKEMPAEDVIKNLTKVTGIGRWTAEIYAMFSLGRADVFAHGDLALQEAAKELFGLEQRPTEKEMINMAQDWTPWRSVAARILWAYYKIITTREGIRK